MLEHLLDLHCALLVLMNNYFVFNPEAVEAIAVPSADQQADQDVQVDDPVIPIRQQQQLLATIRDMGLDLLPKDPDDDNMTERTSRGLTMMSFVRFRVLNTEGDVEDTDDEEDEIVWNPRHD